jgi:hypothetical protein
MVRFHPVHAGQQVTDSDIGKAVTQEIIAAF